ncbi:uncharacterized protein [Thunnus thynnus]|uniref:uncharacterized protein isoform X2 n=1 Tax=Thunnus thynnus TaxID=8237 RepID=UPI0035277E18
MNQCEETEEGVHPSETPLCGQHDNQTKAQRKPDFSESPFSDSKKKVATADRYSVLSSDSGRKKQKMNPPTTQELGVGSSAGMETMSTHLSMAAPQVVCRPVWLGSPRRLGSGGSPSSYSEKDITRSDDDSVLSPASRISLGSPTSSVSSYVSNQCKRSRDRDIDFKKKLGSGGSPSSYSEKDITRSDYDSVLSPDSGISLGSPTSSVSSCVSNQSKRSIHRDFDFKKKLGSGGSPSSYSEKDITRSDDDSVLSPASRISQGSPASSGYRRVSNQSKRSIHRDFDFKKKCMLAMNQCVETEEGVHPSETPLCGQHDNQTKALRRRDFSDSLLSHPLKKLATADGDSVWSLDSWKKQKMNPPTTQELGVGSSAGMETKSTHPPVALLTSPPTTIQPAETSTHPLPATRDK